MSQVLVPSGSVVQLLHGRRGMAPSRLSCGPVLLLLALLAACSADGGGPGGGAFDADGGSVGEACGDGMLGPAESCDVAIPEGVTGSCAVACDDDNPCTADWIDGNGCQARCIHDPIPGCAPDCVGDDCPDACGNGVVDEGETCDVGAAPDAGGCPDTCDDGDPCTRDEREGDGCEVQCTHRPVERCVPNAPFDSTQVEPDGPVFDLALAVAPEGQFRLGLCSRDRLAVYAEAGSGWRGSDVSTEPGIYADCDLVVDGAGHAHLAFTGGELMGSTRFLGYAEQAGDDWHRRDLRPDPVETDATASWGPSIGLMSDGSPRVAYVDVATFGVVYAQPGSSSDWIHHQLLPEGERDASEVEMAIVPTDGGRPHVLWDSPRLLHRHAYWDGTAWRYEDGLDAALLPVLQADEDGVQVAFQGDPDRNPGVYLATTTEGDGLGSEPVDPGWSVQGLAFALGDDGTRHLAYVRTETLYYATAPAGSSDWLIRRVATSTPPTYPVRLDIAAEGGRVAIAIALSAGEDDGSLEHASLTVLVLDPPE